MTTRIVSFPRYKFRKSHKVAPIDNKSDVTKVKEVGKFFIRYNGRVWKDVDNHEWKYFCKNSFHLEHCSNGE